MMNPSGPSTTTQNEPPAGVCPHFNACPGDYSNQPTARRRGGRTGRCHRSLVALSLALLAAGSGLAVEEGKPVPSNIGTGIYPASSLNAHGDDELLLDEVFQSHLPTTLPAYALRFSVHPHLGDLLNKDDLRLTTSLRYGLTRNCEISASSDLYFSHGRGATGFFDRYGAADFRMGAKLNLGQPLFAGWDTATGIDYQFPLGHPPAELTDGLRHIRPYVTFSHRIEKHPDLRIFVGFRFDEVTKTSVLGSFGRNSFRESSLGITGGWVIDRGNLHYTFETAFDTTRGISRNEEDIYSIRPGVIWEIPTRRDPEMMSHWVVGVAVSDTFGPGGNSVGASLKIRYSQDLKNRSHRTPVNPTP